MEWNDADIFLEKGPLSPDGVWAMLSFEPIVNRRHVDAVNFLSFLCDETKA